MYGFMMVCAVIMEVRDKGGECVGSAIVGREEEEEDEEEEDEDRLGSGRS